MFEALHVIGGVLQYGIPSFRLPRDIISREVENLKDMGVKFETNKVIGKTFSIPKLMDEMGYDAVFVGAGAGAPSFLGIPGEFAGQVYSANEFLTRVNLMGGDKFPYLDTPITLGQSVVVIGAGNTAMDCLRVAKRLGAPTVRCVYRRSEAEAPARIEEIRHAKEEGIEFFFLHTPVEIITDDDGGVRGMKVQKMMLGEPDEKGRRKPVPLDEFVELECDTVIYALGTKANPIVTQSTPGLGLNKWGYIVADPETQATTLPGVFAGGDIVTGAATVILAMGAGRRAARAIGAYLQGGKQKWPITQEDADAFVPPVALGAPRRPPQRRPPPRARASHDLLSKVPPPDRRRRSLHLLRQPRTQLEVQRLRQGERGLRLSLRHVPALQRQARDARARADRRHAKAWTRSARRSRSNSAAMPSTSARRSDVEGSGAARTLRPFRRDGTGTHGDPVQALPRGPAASRPRISRSIARPSSPAWSASPRIRPTCFASPSRSRSGR